MSGIISIIGSWIIITLATERATEIINASKLFAPLRTAFGRLAYQDVPDPWYYIRLVPVFLLIHNILTCAWCLSVWVSLFFCWFLPGEYFDVLLPDNILIKWLGLVGMANLWHAIFRLIFNGRVITVDIKHSFTDSEEDDGDNQASDG